MIGVTLCPRCGGPGRICKHCGEAYTKRHAKRGRNWCTPRGHEWVECPECEGAGLAKHRITNGTLKRSSPRA